ncbi:D-2-hydroxyacid dehydrogenase family protein [Marinomonas mediterranea]|uniref:D-2-hydroxyacid dehydrogenase family protein n=1 Tax=Marinomonas mediterranea TaxID=119864 RepID=UPI00234BADDD|nr:D-2-hydroxyacid dehydrogenase family protein [Marinomonas mediterranea]WCN13669.1 D-2-hydroxyacid dehydrogenase family protein [Marinomonas mediterranea]
MKIAILDDYQDVVKNLDCFALLNDHDVTVFTDTLIDEVALSERLFDFDALVLIRERTYITDSLLSRLPNLKLISQTGKVSNHIDVSVCEKHGVKVLEGRGSPVAPSELCWSLIMAASRNLPDYVEQFKAGEWQQSGSLDLGRTLSGLTIGIWGFGKIGQRIAKYASAFDMKVMVWGSESSRDNAVSMGFTAAETKQAFFQKADIVSLHLRLNDVTRGCVKRSDLDVMKADALLVNTSRAELIEEGALYAAMASNPTKRAAIDVYETEPANLANEPLLGLPNVLCSPHIGYVERNSYELYFSVAFENILQEVETHP